MQEYTYLQQVNIFKSVAELNNFIHSFEVAETETFNRPDSIHYPHMILERDPLVLETSGQETWQWAFHIQDKSFEDNCNIIEQYSKVHQIAKSVMAYLVANYTDLFPPVPDYSMTFYYDKDADRVKGCRVELQFLIPNTFNTCDLPYMQEYYSEINIPIDGIQPC